MAHRGKFSNKAALFRLTSSVITLFALCFTPAVSSASSSKAPSKVSSSASSSSSSDSEESSESSSFNITITADSSGISVSAGAPDAPSAAQEILIPDNPVSISTSPLDTVFENSRYENGSLTAEDSLGREWEYDSRLGVFRLRWEEVRSTGSGREGMVFFNDDDTVIVSRDRDPGWAEDIKRVRRNSTRSVHVRAEEYVSRSIKSPKRVTVDGLVEGDVTSLKEVIVGSSGVVNGDVRSPSIKVRSGGLITGDETEVERSLEFGEDFEKEYRKIIDFGAIPIFVGLAVLLILVAFISLSVAPDAVSRASQAISSHTWTTIWVGFLSLLFLPIALSLLIVTFVGIPVAIVVALATPVALLVGIVAYSQFSGRTALAAYGEEGATRLRNIIVGILIIIGLWTLAFALQASRADFLSGIGVFLIIIAIIFSAVAVFSGIGGVVLTRFGKKEYTPKPHSHGYGYPPPPSPPPTPQPPPMPYVYPVNPPDSSQRKSDG
jgi:Polymer-forming cytoskeletal